MSSSTSITTGQQKIFEEISACLWKVELENVTELAPIAFIRPNNEAPRATSKVLLNVIKKLQESVESLKIQPNNTEKPVSLRKGEH